MPFYYWIAVQRAGISEQPNTLNQSEMMNVLSTWTQIPISHLAVTPPHLNEFMHGMQQQIFGQEAAITILGHKLQQSQFNLQTRRGPFCTFLFAGPEHVGKKTVAHALTVQLFKQLHVLYYAQLASSRLSSIADIALQRSHEHHYTPLKEVIRHMPYAVIMLKNVDQASSAVLDGLFEIFSTGFLHDNDGNIYNFRQSIIILSTTLGSRRLNELFNTHSQNEEPKPIDLMQLVMVDLHLDQPPSNQPHLPQEIAQGIIPEITSCLPPALCQHLCIVPFLPLSQSAIEKIIRRQLKFLGKETQARYGMELGYAPEVIRFLMKDVLAKQQTNHQTADIKKSLQPLYFAVEQTMLNPPDDNHSNQLFLQLNETGQFLRCDCLPLRQHAT